MFWIRQIGSGYTRRNGTFHGICRVRAGSEPADGWGTVDEVRGPIMEERPNSPHSPLVRQFFGAQDPTTSICTNTDEEQQPGLKRRFFIAEFRTSLNTDRTDSGTVMALGGDPQVQEL